MSQNTRIVNFVRIKGWYIPADADSYNLLKLIGAPLCKIHGDTLPSLEIAMRPKDIRAKAVNFSEILGPYLDKIGTVWQSKDGRKCKLNDTQLVFTAPLTAKNKKAINSLDSSLTSFFSRWGFSYRPVYSDDSSTRCKLVVDFRFDPDRNPVIPTVEEEPTTPVEVEFGFTKLRITFGKQRTATEYGKTGSWQNEAKKVGTPFHLLEVFTKVGAEWQLVHSGTFMNNTLGELDKWTTTMFELANIRKRY